MLGGTARFSVKVEGFGPFSYQWFKGASPIGGATSDTLVIENLSAGDFTPSSTGSPKYSVQVTNAHGTLTSPAVGLYEDSLGAGLPNWWRQQYFGSLAAVNPSADVDSDGVTNEQEYLDGTNPNNAASRYGRVVLSGPTHLIQSETYKPSYPPGALAAFHGANSGELQFGGFTGSHRTKAKNGFSFYMPGSSMGTGDVFLKGLFGSMPVKEAGTAPTFTFADSAPSSVIGFATASWGSWIAWGSFDRVNGQPRTAVARFAADDSLDAGFVPQPNGVVTGAVILPDGKFFVSGLFSEIGGQLRDGLARFLADGTLDISFNPGSGGGGSTVTTLAAQRDGKVLLGGSLWDGSTFRPLMRRNTNGSVDASFVTTADSPPSVFTQQPDGKILMSGNIATVNGTTTPKLVRLNLDGTLDSTFSLVVANGAVTSEPRRLIVQPDGKILVGGNVQVRLNGSTVNVPLARLNANGTLDSAFTQKVHALAAGLTFADITLQTDGRVVGVGTFTLATPSVVNAVRFKADGNVDPDCFVISRPNGPAYAVAAQVNDNLLIGGRFSDLAVASTMVNDHTYLVTPAKMSWTASEALAVKLGGHLASISSARENQFLVETMLPLKGLTTNPAWMGLFDQGAEGIFSWTSGEPVTYTNWQPGEPGGGTTENYTALNWMKAYNGTAPDKWVDIVDGGTTQYNEASTGPYYGIIEIENGASPPTTSHWVAGRDFLSNVQPGSPAQMPNPNLAVPAWSYGCRPTLASSALTLYTSGQRTGDANFEGWLVPGDCSVFANTQSFPTGHLGSRPVFPGELSLHPGSDLSYSIVRWTAPEAGTFAVNVFWQDYSWGMGDGASGSIVVNGAVVFTQDFDNGNGTFEARVLSLNAGDTVDFALGARGGFHADSTRFNATVTKIQNASSLWVGGRDLAINEKPDGNANETTNPNPSVPQWSYGYRSTLITSGLDLALSHTNTGLPGDDAMEGWKNGDAAVLSNTGTTPVTYNFGFGPNLPFNPGEILISPAGSSGPFPVLRWTAPAAGRYELLAYWHDIDAHGGNGFSAHLVVNGAQVYGQDLGDGAGSSVAHSLDLKAGDQVDFLMGTRGDYSFDTTKFNVAIVRPANATPHVASSSTIAPVGIRTGIQANDAIDWSAARATNGDISGNPFVVASSAGVEYHVRKATTGTFTRLTQGNGWFGNFAPGDAVLNHANSNGPVVIEAASRNGVCSAIGMQIMSNQNGPFGATLRAYDINGTLLGTVNAIGTGNANADNSAIFIGLESFELNLGVPYPVENIHSVTIDTDTNGFGGDFAINQVSIKSTIHGSLSNLRTNFARLVPTNDVQPLQFYSASGDSIFASGAPATLNLTSNAGLYDISFASLEISADGVTYQPFGYGSTTDGVDFTFAVPAVPPGQNYFRAMLQTQQLAQPRTHAVTLIAPPVVTSQLAAAGEVGQPFSYTGTATGALTGFTATSLPAWATATFDANSNTLSITGTPTSGVTSSISLQPANAAGSTTSSLVLSITSPFSSWQDANFTAGELLNPNISGPLGDATGAGIPNLIKYALGIPPKQPGIAGMPTGDVEDYGASDYLTLVYTRDKSVQGITLTVEVSGDLGIWQSGPTLTTEVSRVSHPNNTETVTVRDNVPTSSGQPRFIRLKVTQ